MLRLQKWVIQISPLSPVFSCNSKPSGSRKLYFDAIHCRTKRSVTGCLSITSNNHSVEKHKKFAMSAQQYSFLIASLKRAVEDHYPITVFLAHDNNYIFKNKSEKLLFHPSYSLPHIVRHRKNVLLGDRCQF